jgi:hypothetical protein
MGSSTSCGPGVSGRPCPKTCRESYAACRRFSKALPSRALLADLSVAVQAEIHPLEDARRLEYHDPAGRGRHLLASLPIAADALALLAHH